MIYLRKINDKEIVINCDKIESIQESPDTIILLSNGKKIIVKNSIDEIVEKTVEFKRKLYK